MIFPSERLILQSFRLDEVSDATKEDLSPLLKRLPETILNTCLLS